jgi:hypothetical protein
MIQTIERNCRTLITASLQHMSVSEMFLSLDVGWVTLNHERHAIVAKTSNDFSSTQVAFVFAWILILFVSIIILHIP